MEYALPIAAGALCGVVAGLPYLAAFVYSRRTRALSVLPGFAAMAVSALVIIACLVGAWVLARDAIVAFALALVALFFVVVSVGAAWFLRRPRP